LGGGGFADGESADRDGAEGRGLGFDDRAEAGKDPAAGWEERFEELADEEERFELFMGQQ
jgi:hypothetical protein